jgi:hypothetical protein
MVPVLVILFTLLVLFLDPLFLYFISSLAIVELIGLLAGLVILSPSSYQPCYLQF